MGIFKDLTGMVLGNNTVIERDTSKKGKHTYWICICICGNRRSVSADILTDGQNRKCIKCRTYKTTVGFTNKTHGLSRSPTYKSWRGMKSRACPNTKSKSYIGISYCERWEIFDNFLQDMGLCPNGKTLDRINSFGNYFPENCRWATRKEQQNNKRKNWIVYVYGEKMTFSQAVDKFSEHNYRLVANRIRCMKWDLEKALKTPKTPKEKCYDKDSRDRKRNGLA